MRFADGSVPDSSGSKHEVLSGQGSYGSEEVCRFRAQLKNSAAKGHGS